MRGGRITISYESPFFAFDVFPPLILFRHWADYPIEYIQEWFEIRTHSLKMFGKKYYGLTGFSLNLAIGVIAGLE